MVINYCRLTIVPELTALTDSDADDVIQKPTNRGNKRKRGAKFVQEGRLDLANSVKRCRKVRIHSHPSPNHHTLTVCARP